MYILILKYKLDINSLLNSFTSLMSQNPEELSQLSNIVSEMPQIQQLAENPAMQQVANSLLNSGNSSTDTLDFGQLMNRS